MGKVIVRGVEPVGDTMGLRGLSGCNLGMGMLAGCMLVFFPMVKSLVTQHMLHSMTGVSKDCRLQWVASLETGEVGGLMDSAVLVMVWFWLEPMLDIQMQLVFEKKWKDALTSNTKLRRHARANRIT